MATKKAAAPGTTRVASADSLQNIYSGMGGSGDKQMGLSWVSRTMNKQQLDAAYRGDWIARKVIDIPAFDSVRAWRGWQADKDDITKIELGEDAINIKHKMLNVLRKGRLYGGGALILGINQGKPEDPVDVSKIKKGDLKFVHAVSRWEISAGPIIQDLESPWFGEPEYYDRSNVYTGVSSKVKSPMTTLRLHPSRVVRLVGLEAPDQLSSIDGWGDPVLQVVADAIRAAGTVSNAVAQLVDEAKLDVIGIPGLTENSNNKDYEARLMKRFGLASNAKSIYNILMLDKDEEWRRITQSFSTLPEIMQMYMILASGAADIPVTRMMGESPKGLNATGQSDIRNYYDMVNTKQTMDIGPVIKRLDEVLIRSTLGAYPDGIFYKWTPLWQMDEAQIADIANKKAATFKIDNDAGLIDSDVLKQARENQLIEDGTYPGLEQLIEEHEAAIEAGLIPDPADPKNQPCNDPVTGLPLPPVQPAIDPKTGLPLPPAPVAKPSKSLPVPTPANNNRASAVKKAVGDSLARIRRTNVTDAKPRTLYVRRDLLNWSDVAAWFKKQGFETTTGASMHVTIAFSRTPIDWMTLGSDWGNSSQDGTLDVTPGGVRIVERLGDATALLFVSSDLQWRWSCLKERGADWSWPDYQPHITISWEIPEGFDLSKVVPYRGPLKFGPEIFEEINEDWAEQLVEDAKAALLWPK